MTLKVLVILHHFSQYFELTNTTMRDTNGEYVETLQSSLRIHEENHGYKVVSSFTESQNVLGVLQQQKGRILTS